MHMVSRDIFPFITDKLLRNVVDGNCLLGISSYRLFFAYMMHLQCAFLWQKTVELHAIDLCLTVQRKH